MENVNNCHGFAKGGVQTKSRGQKVYIQRPNKVNSNEKQKRKRERKCIKGIFYLFSFHSSQMPNWRRRFDASSFKCTYIYTNGSSERHSANMYH